VTQHNVTHSRRESQTSIHKRGQHYEDPRSRLVKESFVKMINVKGVQDQCLSGEIDTQTQNSNLEKLMQSVTKINVEVKPKPRYKILIP